MNLRRVYETTIIINAALTDSEVDATINKITTYLENHGGEIEEKNLWGRRRLAYPINKKFNGCYVHLIFNAAPSIVPALERFLTLDETVLRHLTLQLSDALRAYRKEKSLAEGKSGETSMSTVAEEVAAPKPSETEEPISTEESNNVEEPVDEPKEVVAEEKTTEEAE
ncbi:MAG: 30S ribosomal protein S6 [Bacteroidetes bacterium]|nr:30S ribosomal protein S6 [Bacteroidota bacterium]